MCFKRYVKAGWQKKGQECHLVLLYLLGFLVALLLNAVGYAEAE